MTAKSILLISQKTDDLEFAQGVALEAGLESVSAANVADGAKRIASEEPMLVFADTSNLKLFQDFENAVHESVGLFSDAINPNLIHFVSSSPLGEAPTSIIQSPLFGHWIQKGATPPKEAGRQYGRLVKATLAERAFGLAQLMRPGTKIQTIKLVESGLKLSAVEAVKKYLLAAKFPSRVATLIANAVDELLMNSIFDAPVDPLGKPIYSSTARTTNIKLEGKHAVELNLGFDGEYVAIQSVDCFGSLDKPKLLAHVSKMYTNEDYKVKSSVAGAGIGLANVFRSGASFLFASEAGERTEVSVFFKRTDSFREMRDQFQFISTQFYS